MKLALFFLPIILAAASILPESTLQKRGWGSVFKELSKVGSKAKGIGLSMKSLFKFRRHGKVMPTKPPATKPPTSVLRPARYSQGSGFGKIHSTGNSLKWNEKIAKIKTF